MKHGKSTEDTQKHEKEIEEPKKNMAAVALGRLGGLKGGNARAKALSAKRRSEIARLAAITRWKSYPNKERKFIMPEWSKTLTRSDAQQETAGAKMPFRFTKGNSNIDHTTWFRDVFFADENWRSSRTSQGNPIEQAEIAIHVIIQGQDKGIRRMTLDHGEYRDHNHSAPATHLHYDSETKHELASQNLTGHTVVFHAGRNNDGAPAYQMIVD
jgi:hypothetical protein